MDWIQISVLIVSQVVLTLWTYWMKTKSDASHKAWVEERDVKANKESENRKKIEWNYIEKRDEYDRKKQEKATDKLALLQSSVDSYHNDTKTMIETYISLIGKPPEKKK